MLQSVATCTHIKLVPISVATATSDRDLIIIAHLKQRHVLTHKPKRRRQRTTSESVFTTFVHENTGYAKYSTVAVQSELSDNEIDKAVKD